MASAASLAACFALSACWSSAARLFAINTIRATAPITSAMLLPKVRLRPNRPRTPSPPSSSFFLYLIYCLYGSKNTHYGKNTHALALRLHALLNEEASEVEL